MSKIVGIDLGTTHSLVAVVEKGHAVVLSDHDGLRLIPSVVALHDTGRVLTGSEAKAYGRPLRTVYSFKRFMGRGLADVRDTLAHWPFDFSGSTDETVRVNLVDRRFTPVELSSLILKRLKTIADSHGLEPIKQCVITVPAYFNDAQRQATLMAGKLAGLEVLRIVNEPTAACLAYGLDRKRDGIVAVYDLGGGTFDVSILKLKDGIFEVLSTHGHTELGGDDFDWALVAHLEDVLQRERVLSDEALAQLREPLRRAAETAKKELSSAEETFLSIEHPSLGGTWHHPVTRVELESLMAPLLERTVHSCHQALQDAGLEASAISDVVLVGGSTRIPLVKRLVQDLFGRVPNDSLNPDEVVALGAAIQADVLAGQREDVLLLDVIPLSLGIETMGGAVSKLISRNTTVPTSAREIFTTSADNQTAVTVHVVQGERELVSECRSLARFSIPVGLAPAGIPRVEIKFAIDANGTLQVTGKDLRTGHVQSLVIRSTFGLTETEIEQMIQDSILHAAADTHARELIELRQEASIVLAATEKSQASPAAATLAPEERQHIELAIAVLRKAMEGSDIQLLKQALDVLNAETRHLAELVMSTTLHALASGETLE